MSRERRQVLDLLAEGKVTAEEAERLLERLAQVSGEPASAAGNPRAQAAEAVASGDALAADDVSSRAGGGGGTGGAGGVEGEGLPGFETMPQGATVSGPASRAGGRTPKFLRVVVNSADGDQVNVRVPIALVRTGIKLGAMLPKEAREKLNERGIDLSSFSGMEGEELVEALRELTVDVDSAQGDVVRVFCE